MQGEVGDLTVVSAVIIISFLALVVYDVYLYATNKPTLSVVVYKWSWYKPWVPFAFGFLCGHWFW